MLGCRLCCSIWLAPTAIATCRAWSRWSNSKPGSGNRAPAITFCRRIFTIMFDSTRLLLFLTAAVLLAVAPGPGMLYVLARSLAGGKREGALSALGTFLGGTMPVLSRAQAVSVILSGTPRAVAHG